MTMMKSTGSKPEKKYTKSNLPQKDCIVCNRPFDWRKKWEKVWDEVKYCSERCRRNKQQSTKKSDDTDDDDNSNSSSGNNQKMISRKSLNQSKSNSGSQK